MNSYSSEILDLEKKGYTNFNSFFNKSEIEELSTEVEKIIKEETDSHTKRDREPLIDAKAIADRRNNRREKPYHHSNYASCNTFSSSVAGKSKKIDEFFKNLFSDPRFNFLCEKLVGKEFRIYTFAIRQLDSFSQPLGLHQDSWAQLSFSIPLNDISSKDASTIMIPGSHLFNFPIFDEFFYIPRFLYSFLTTTLKGNVGDLNLFLNKTFHGNCVTKKTNKKSTCIHIGLIAEGGHSYTSFIPIEKTNYGTDFRDAVGDEIYKKMFSMDNLHLLDNKKFTYLENYTPKTEIKTHAISNSKKHVVRSLSPAITKETKHFIDKIFLKKSYLLLHLSISSYLRAIIYLKKIYKKVKIF